MSENPLDKVPSSAVGRLEGEGMIKAEVFPCGHVQLIKGMKHTTVEFETARKYAADLQALLDAALIAAQQHSQ